MEYLAEFGYWGLFLSAFLAATLLPLSSEIVLIILLVQGLNTGGLLFCAALGNILGSIVNYLLGRYGSDILLKRFLRLSDFDVERAVKRFEKYGVASLFFAWVPVIGDPLTVVAGIMKIRFFLFVIAVSLGKIFRYLTVSWVVLAV